MKEGPQWFSDMFLYELLLPHKKIRMFGPKTAIFAPKHAFISTYMYLAGVFGALSVGRLVGCGVSRKTPIYFMIFVPKTHLARRLFTLYIIFITLTTDTIMCCK